MDSSKVLGAVKDTTGHTPRQPLRLLTACGIVLLAGLASYAVFRSDPWGEARNRLPASFQLNLQQQLQIDSSQIHYRLHAQIDLPLEAAHAIATGPLDGIYVASDGAVHIFLADGAPQQVIDVAGEASCLAVGGPEHVEPGQLYVGGGDGVFVFDAEQKPAGRWPLPNDRAILTSIALGEHDIFVADAGNRVIWRFNSDGQLAGQIGSSDPKAPDFVVSSPYFDVVVGAADLLHIVNPGKLQVAAYTFDGDFGNAWGRASSTLDGFFGCCNPSHLAMLPDGRFVTSEKGIPRVKVYSPQGEFAAVVAGPQQLGIEEGVVADPRCADDRFIFDIAVDNRGRVLVLDDNRGKVLIFVENESEDVTGDDA